MKYVTQGLLTAAFLWAGCQTAPTIESQDQAILGGDLTQVGEFPTVVALVDDFGGICTGTLIAPRVVLTAAHCVDPVLFGGGFDEADVAASMNIVFDSTDAFGPVFFGDPGLVVGATKTVKNPSFNINLLGDDDIGLVFLDEAVTDREPSPLDLDNTRNLVGTFVTQVGFGISDQNPDAGTEVVLEDKRVDACAQTAGGSDRELVCYDQTDGSGKCGGDSGGPSFDAEGRIVGVTSFGDQDCVFFGADTRISAPSELAFLENTILANSAIACGADGFAFELCGEANDPDFAVCQDNDGFCGLGCSPRQDSDCGRGCSVDVGTTSSSDVASMFALFGLFSLGLFLSRRKSR